MAFSLGDVFITLKAKSEQLDKGLDDADRKSRSAAGAISNSFKSATAGSAALLGTLTAVAGAATLFGKSSVDAYFAAEQAQTKLRTNLLNVKGATDAHVDSLSRQASALQAVGVIEDDVIKAGMSQLATFNLQGKTIETLTPKITDMVAQLKGHNATAEDMVGINNLVGKVMTGNVGALSRYGVTLSENQAKMISEGTEAQRAAVLVEVLGQNYGKVNEELRKTPQGRITGMKNAFGDLQEGVGEFIVTAAGPLIDKFAGVVAGMEKAGGIAEWFGQQLEGKESMLVAIGGAITVGILPALYAMAGGIWAVMAPLIPWLALGAALGLLLKALADRMGGWGALWEALKGPIDAAKGALEGVWNVGESVVGFFQRFEAARAVLAGAILGGLIPVFISLAISLWGVVTGLIAAGAAAVVAALPFLPFILLGAAIAGIAYLIITNWDTLKGWFSAFWGFVTGIFSAAWQWIKDNWMLLVIFLMGPIAWFAAFVIANWESIRAFAGAVFQWIKDFISNKINEAKSIIGSIIGFFSHVFGTARNIVVDIFNNMVNFIAGIPGRFMSGLGNIASIVSSPFRDAFNAVARFWNNTVGKLSFKAPDWVPGMGGKGFSLPQLPTLALGTGNWRGGMVRMNEFGMETAVLPPGTRVTTAAETERAQNGGKGNVYHIHLDGVLARSRTELADLVLDGVKAADERLSAAGKPTIMQGGGV